MCVCVCVRVCVCVFFSVLISILYVNVRNALIKKYLKKKKKIYCCAVCKKKSKEDREEREDTRRLQEDDGELGTRLEQVVRAGSQWNLTVVSRITNQPSRNTNVKMKTEK